MSRTWQIHWLIYLTLLLTSCVQETWKERTLAKVNGQTITVGEFLAELEGMKGERFAAPADAKEKREFQEMKEKVLEQMIQERLLLQEAHRRKLVVQEKEFQNRIAGVQQGFSNAEFKKILQERGMTEAEWRSLEKDRMLTEQVYQQEIADKINIPVAAVAAYYAAHPDDFVVPESVRVRQIRVATEAQAHEILGKLKQDRKVQFAEMARKFSLEAPEAETGGDLGFYAKGEMPEVFDKAFDMKIGAISDVLESPYGYHILKVEEKRPRQHLTLEQATPRIVSILRQEQELVLFQAWKERLYADAKIAKNKRVLRDVQ